MRTTTAVAEDVTTTAAATVVVGANVAATAAAEGASVAATVVAEAEAEVVVVEKEAATTTAPATTTAATKIRIPPPGLNTERFLYDISSYLCGSIPRAPAVRCAKLPLLSVTCRCPCNALSFVGCDMLLSDFSMYHVLVADTDVHQFHSWTFLCVRSSSPQPVL